MAKNRRAFSRRPFLPSVLPFIWRPCVAGRIVLARNRHEQNSRGALLIAFSQVSVGAMGDENAAPTNSITVDVRVYMHCDSCERSVRRTIKKIDGVETVEVDREENKITVTGDFKPHKLLKKIKKKTGKKAEIVVPDPEPEVNEEENQEEAWDVHAPYRYPAPGMDVVLGNEFLRPPRWDLHYFDDENTEACRIM